MDSKPQHDPCGMCDGTGEIHTCGLQTWCDQCMGTGSVERAPDPTCPTCGKRPNHPHPPWRCMCSAEQAATAMCITCGGTGTRRDGRRCPPCARCYGSGLVESAPGWERGRPVPTGTVDEAAGLFVCESCDTLLPRAYRSEERCCFMCGRSEPLDLPGDE
jgi:DnaJ-class molecular chaperone